MPPVAVPESRPKPPRPWVPRASMASALVLGAALMTGVAAAPPADAAEIAVPAGGPGSVALTVHNGTAVVRERRPASLPAGESVLAFPDVPDGADATSVRLTVSGGDAGSLRVLERALSADVPSQQRLLELSVGQEIGLLIHDQGPDAPPRRATARVLSVAEDVVLEMDGAIRVGLPGELVLDSLPEGLRASPTLLATVATEAGGDETLDLTYLTSGLNWQADYALDLGDSLSGGDLRGWATVTNTSGRSFDDAHLTLAAGTVNTGGGGGARPEMAMRSDSLAMAAMPATPAPQAQGGLYFYPVERPVSLAHRQTKQVALVDAPGVTVTPRYVIPAPSPEVYANARTDEDEVNAARWLVLTNTEDAGLGRPLPAGTVRVWQAGPDGAPRFLGADQIGHTAVGAEATLRLGTDFDITAERRRLAFRRIGERVTESEHEIVVHNGKSDQPVTVTVQADLPGDRTLLSESHERTRESANRVAWTLEVPAEGETRLTYAIRTQF
ncbi:DUF4139 domain-containing protein [Roseospira marina]|uniref:DUF4139 domain-containing protein n=1 Tax=Roseospira marina TaxID=140057 RepID=A0A5M6IAG4_9PROT|nr:DUF4139 domain-containing protein [Roseospira marina]KAA5605251.1 DUF4139 domain-containing protein [Roseospira marina]MBB4314710.1 hypothetical protein [Roseospira marina]MBB5087699.1 hypothetical protein [Roseospira marina]